MTIIEKSVHRSLRPLGSLLRFDNQDGRLSPIRVRGVVTSSQPGQGLYVQDGSQGVFVQSGQTTPVALGSRLEAVGYPAAGRYSHKLEDAVFGIVGAGQAPNGLREPAAGMIVDVDGFRTAPYDSVLVQLKGRLIKEIPGADQDLLLFQDGKSIFTARPPGSEHNRRELATGGLMSITGVCGRCQLRLTRRGATTKQRHILSSSFPAVNLAICGQS
jgi:hypothetical protein